MKRHSQILAGTALGLLMASAPLAALPLPETTGSSPVGARVAEALPLILAQATPAAETEEERLRREAEEAAPPAAAEPPAAPEAPAVAEEPVEEEAPAAAEEPAAAPEAPAVAEEPVEEAPAAAEEPAAAPEAPAVAEEPVEEEAPAAAEEPAAAPEAPATAEQPAAAPEAPATAEEPAAAPEAPAAAEQPAAAPQAPATAEEPAAAPPPATAEQPAAPEAPAATEAPADGQAPATAEQPATAPEAPAAAQDPAAAPPPATAEGQPPAPENAAPILDSAKGAPAPAAGEPAAGGQAAQPAPAPQQATPMPENDAAAQAQPIAEVESVTAEEGQRIEAGATREERQERRRERRERRDDVEVIEEFNDNRVIIEFNNQVFIESPDYERIIYDSEEVYYEELQNGRVREVIVRADGSRVVTIRNRFGDVVRRSRILPDNSEIVLVYVEDRYYDQVLEWRDPGLDLPPLVLSIPREEYILEAELVDDPDRYYAFLDQPPVEQVERTYSLNEVKRSARIRDKVRRVDLDTINFEFGSAEIPESEIADLEGVAQAMEQLLTENPGETFLIEGHTDAVGTDLANLALSDQRAEAVATALTSVFAIPPENLTTQGYGEQYLKIQTEEPQEENRRVAIRRITALVSPVASAE